MLADLDPDGIYLCMLDAYPYMMSTCQVAEALNVTPQAIRKQLNAGQLRGTRMGSSWIVPKAQLLRYLYRNHNYTSD